jgi:hypothetical protein
MPNKAGLCVWLQISGDTYNEYKKRFSETLKATEEVIQNARVQRLKVQSEPSATAVTTAAFTGLRLGELRGLT